MVRAAEHAHFTYGRGSLATGLPASQSGWGQREPCHRRPARSVCAGISRNGSHGGHRFPAVPGCFMVQSDYRSHGIEALQTLQYVFSHSVPTVSSVRAFPPLIIHQIKPSRTVCSTQDSKSKGIIAQRPRRARRFAVTVRRSPFGVRSSEFEV